ncbi:3-isopropylmalate dehydratase large subunit [uncultured Tateyamaria sp.]|uniref:3-isopropylmalate dehydratase large subunit n=1 Tax=uncultured Tateyamaria sp. TaxID=455651 RepID=UPI002611A7E7|nr:3-isopropylmalate dehydratase large subunit [uncultured Tateyamaria sp.]
MDKLWNEHFVSSLPDGRDLLFIDRHILHEVCSPQAISILEKKGLKVAHPELTFATIDHIAQTHPLKRFRSGGVGNELSLAIRKAAQTHGFELFDLNDERQGIVHVTMPSLGIVQPGMFAACGDSHTCSLGAIGCLGFVVSISEIAQILATQTIYRSRPKTLKIELKGELQKECSAKDVILWLLGKIGVNGATGFVIEFCGKFVEDLSIEGRFTLCNMAAEMGAFSAVIAPDRKTIEFLEGAEYAPKEEQWREAVVKWLELTSDDDAKFDRQMTYDVSLVDPQITWGTRPDHVISVTDHMPSDFEAQHVSTALDYMGLSTGKPIEGTPIDTAFIGSCTNGRLSDLISAAAFVKGRRVAEGVRAMVVPGSRNVQNEAEARGLDKIFVKAGFEWHYSGCSMCAALNNDKVGPFERCISTSNRNFPGRQGINARTHLASPATVAASAIEGRICDPRKAG